MDKVARINKVLKAYFRTNSSINLVAVKDLMPEFIKAGIFLKDEKKGLPIRKLLRDLNNKKALGQIPFVYADRKMVNIHWFFQRSADLTVQEIPLQSDETATRKQTRKGSDEHYVIDLCDEVLGTAGQRQYRFTFLIGDPNARGICSKLPVDVYYPDLNRVIEYKERQHYRPVQHFDKPEKITVSGVHRGKQRKMYDQRRLTILPLHGIRVIEIFCDELNCRPNGRLVRDAEFDFKKIKEKLNAS